jgi:hypothetical protein
MGYHSSGLLEISSWSSPKTTVGTRLAMEKGEYQRIREMRSPVSKEEMEALTIWQMKQRIESTRAAKADEQD